MPEVTCPQCGRPKDLVAIRREADEFCPHCDYPLFWAKSGVPAMSRGGPSNDGTLRRLPGAGGRRLIGNKICPTCGELNPVKRTLCLRCDAELDPRPAAPEPEPAPIVVAVPPSPPPLPPPTPAPQPAVTPWFVWAFWASTAASLVLLLITR